MRQVTFIRHAKVDMDSTEPINAKALKAWEEAYNNAPIVTHFLPEDELIIHIRSADYVLSSTHRRTVDSLTLLGVSIDEKNPLFNEAVIPTLQGSLIKLKPVYWLVLFRILSLLGVGRWDRTLKQSEKDALLAAIRLEELSQQHEKIVLMGHGVMNWLILKALKKRGWQLKGRESHQNWGMIQMYCSPAS